MRDTLMKGRPLRALLYGGVTLLLLSPLLPAPDPGDAAKDSLEQEIAGEREAQQHWMTTSATSFLTAIQRVTFDGRSVLTVGHADDNDVRLEGDDIASHHLRITLRPEGYYSLEAQDPEAAFVVKQAPVRAADVRGGSFRVGRFTLSLSPAAAPVLLVSDPHNPKLQSFAGLQYFPIDRDRRFVVSLVEDPERTVVELPGTKGPVAAQRQGWFEFTVEDQPLRLEVHRLLAPTVRSSEFAVFFRDATTGRETSTLGRQVDPLRLPDGRYLLDFNRATHSACVHSEHYQCPQPPPANTLPLPMLAGERLAAPTS